MTKRLIFYIVLSYKDIRSVSEVAKEIGLSIPTVFRILGLLHMDRKPLPKVFCIDEFKGDSGGNKCQTTLGDGAKRTLIDILPTRYFKDLSHYFSQIEEEERNGVEVFVSDMSRVFKEVKKIYFKNSIHVVDKYHFIRQVHWALENVRKREQGLMPSKERKYFKRSRSLLKKPAKKLNNEEKEVVAFMLEMNDEIRKAYQ